MSSTAVRDSNEGDVEAVLRIYAHYVLHSAATFEEVVPSLDEMRRRRNDVLASGLPFLVVEVDGVVSVRRPHLLLKETRPLHCTPQHGRVVRAPMQGYAYAGQYRKERTAYRYTVEDSIYLDPERRGLVGPSLSSASLVMHHQLSLSLSL
jgi:phosphinothricin acetyltransferase